MSAIQSFKFKRGSGYSRDDIHFLYFEKPVPKRRTGTWTTGYVQPQGSDDLIIFMNIGVAGKTGHDFNNKFDPETNTIVWFGKPKSHSGQPTFKKILSKELTPHFFARWDTKNKFVYLGTGSVVDYKDSVQTSHGSAIKLIVSCDEAKEILSYSIPEIGNSSYAENLNNEQVIERCLLNKI